jgi:hypothetical protein
MNSKTKLNLMKLGGVCISLTVWVVPTISIRAADLAPLHMQALSLHIPTNTPGLSRSIFTNSLNITGWINTNTLVVVTATNCDFFGYSNVAPFHVLQSLIQAYQGADLQRVQNLYDSSSSNVIAATLADPEVRSRWFQFATNIQAIVPLLIWNETNKIVAITWALRGNPILTGTNSSLLPMVFDTNFTLVAAQLRSPVVNYLSAYFADGSRSPNGLLSTNNPSTNQLRLR